MDKLLFTIEIQFNMTKVKIFLHSYDLLDDRAIENLTYSELECVKCYTVEKSIPKKITSKVERINEWELEWNDYSYRDKKYYDYGAIVHLIQNPHLLEGLTHVGLMQYDVLSVSYTHLTLPTKRIV